MPQIPIGFLSQIFRRIFSWSISVSGLGASKYPLFKDSSNLSSVEIDELCSFINKGFAIDFSPYTTFKIKSWIGKCPTLYHLTYDRVLLSKNPINQRLVGVFKLVPLNKGATDNALQGIFEPIDIASSDIAINFETCKGIWIGDLIVESPLFYGNSHVIGRHMLEQIKTIVRSYSKKVPIFCRTMRPDIQKLLLNSGFSPIIIGNEVTEKTIWVHKKIARLNPKTP